MTRLLVLQHLFNLSDEQMEFGLTIKSTVYNLKRMSSLLEMA